MQHILIRRNLVMKSNLWSCNLVLMRLDRTVNLAKKDRSRDYVVVIFMDMSPYIEVH